MLINLKLDGDTSSFWRRCRGFAFVFVCSFVCWIDFCLLVCSNSILRVLLNDCFFALVWLPSLAWLISHDVYLNALLRFVSKSLIFHLLLNDLGIKSSFWCWYSASFFLKCSFQWLLIVLEIACEKTTNLDHMFYLFVCVFMFRV